MILLIVLGSIPLAWCAPFEDGLMNAEEGKELKLDVLHINDIHSYFEETNHYSARCRQSSDKCVGGVARLYTKQKEIRDRNPDTTIFLNAGDFYQGTVWYSQLKYEPMITFGNHIGYTAMGIGNHDFDDHVAGLIPFADKVSFPLLAANMNSSGSGFDVDKHYHKSCVKTINGTKVGIIGYITQITSYNFPNSAITFHDEIQAVKTEAESLKNDSVEIIIALGHSGYEIDIELAKQIPLLDLVVGGHSHTFLYTAENDTDVPEDFIRGPYPTYVTPEGSDKKIPVVQAKAFGKYLGHLTLNFDKHGELKKPEESAGVTFAKPYLLDGSINPDQNTLDMMKPFQEKLSDFKQKIGEVESTLSRQEVSEESNIGNAITDSMAAVYADTDIAVTNNEGIRNDFESGDMTKEDIFYVLPFNNTIDKLTLKGRELKKGLEVAASKIDNNDKNKYPGFGLQVAGVKLEIEAREDNHGNRITSFKVYNSSSQQYEDLELDEEYKIAVGSYLAPSGRQKASREIFDGITIIDHQVGDKTDFDAFVDWVKDKKVVNSTIEGRLSVKGFKSSSAATPIASIALLFITIFLAN